MLDLYVINLKERIDRLENIRKVYSSFNIIPIEAVKHSIGQIGCFMSHKKCIKLAKDKNMKQIIVIEDDCIPIGNFENKISEIIHFLKEYKDWDIMIGGGFHIEPFHIEGKIKLECSSLFKTNGGYCMHFVIYNETCYDYFLNYDETKVPIDHIWQNNLRCFVPIPFIAIQMDGFSNISNDIQNSFAKRIRLTNKRISDYVEKNKIKNII